MGQLFNYKMRRKFIIKCIRLFITKFNSFVAKLITKCVDFITNCDSYHKMRRYKLFKDTVKAFYDFKSEQQKCLK